MKQNTTVYISLFLLCASCTSFATEAKHPAPNSPTASDTGRRVAALDREITVLRLSLADALKRRAALASGVSPVMKQDLDNRRKILESLIARPLDPRTREDIDKRKALFKKLSIEDERLDREFQEIEKMNRPLKTHLN